MGRRLLFRNKIAFLSMKIVIVWANNIDPDEMRHSKAFLLSLHCLCQCQLTHLGQCAKG